MSRLLRQRAGRGRIEVRSEIPEGNATMNAVLRMAGGHAPADAQLGAGPNQGGDELERRAGALGCVDVAALRRLAPELEDLAGAALESALQRTLADRQWLAPEMDALLERRPAGLDAGAGGRRDYDEPPSSMNAVLRATRAVKAQEVGDYARALDRQRGDGG